MLLLHFNGVMASTKLDRINSLRESLAAYVYPEARGWDETPSLDEWESNSDNDEMYPEARGWDEEEEWLEYEPRGFDEVLDEQSREARSGRVASTQCPLCSASQTRGGMGAMKIAKADNNARTFFSNYNSWTLPNIPLFLRGATIFQGSTEFMFRNKITLSTGDGNVKGNFYVFVMAGGKGLDAGMGGEDGTLAAEGWKLLSSRADGMKWDAECQRHKRHCIAPENYFDIWRSPDDLGSVDLPLALPRFRTRQKFKEKGHLVIPFFKAGAPTSDPPVIDPKVRPRVLDASKCHTALRCDGWGVEAPDYMKTGAQMYNNGQSMAKTTLFNFNIPSYLQEATYYKGGNDFQNQDGGSNVLKLRGGTVGSDQKECGRFYMLVENDSNGSSDGGFLQSLPAAGWTQVETLNNPRFGNGKRTQTLTVFKSPSISNEITLPGSKKRATSHFNREWVRAYVFFKSGGACPINNGHVCYDYYY